MPIYLTTEGRLNLEQRYTYLSTVRQPEVQAHLRTLGAGGDVIESAELEESKTELARIRHEILLLRTTLDQAQAPIEHNGLSGVTIGCLVTLRSRTGEEEQWRVVHPAETCPRQHKISSDSPLGKELIGRRKGARIDLSTPNGPVQYHLVAIESHSPFDQASLPTPPTSCSQQRSPSTRANSTSLPKVRVSSGAKPARS